MDAAEEVTKVLDLDKGWMSSDAIWNRTEVRHKDVVSDAIKRLVKNGAIQKRMGSLGHEYAALGVAGAEADVKPLKAVKLDPALHVPAPARPARASAALPTVPPMPIVPYADLGPSRVTAATAPLPTPPPAAAADAPAKAKRAYRRAEQIDDAIVEALGREPMSRTALKNRFSLGGAGVQRTLERLLSAGRVEKQPGQFGLYGLPTTNASPAIEPGAQPAVASNSGSSGGDAPAVQTSIAATEPASPRDGLTDAERAEILRLLAEQDQRITLPPPVAALADEGSFRCALWSDGQLEICSGDINLVLPTLVTKRLFAYLDGVRVEGATA
ncbi:hypothetical protein [Hydrocarboniphaga effusa]|uniref:hypothetical protein n=1 Tax=Hydrocarboniphaga effusa TaxID=243629 RepID=UPI003BAD5DD0